MTEIVFSFLTQVMINKNLYICILLSYLFVYCCLCVGLEIGGEMNLTAGIQIAQLALKHRQNKKQKQRIIVFAGRYPQNHSDFFLSP